MKTQDQVRVGTVSAFHPETGTVDVKFFTAQDPVAKELTMIAHEYRPIEPGMMVMCFFQEHGEGRGFCVGPIYTDNRLPKNPGEQFTRVDFRDGFIEHDRDQETLTIGGVKKLIIQCPVEVTEGNVDILAGDGTAMAGDFITSVRTLNTHGH